MGVSAAISASELGWVCLIAFSGSVALSACTAGVGRWAVGCHVAGIDCLALEASVGFSLHSAGPGMLTCYYEALSNALVCCFS